MVRDIVELAVGLLISGFVAVVFIGRVGGIV
jgi:hypothetical protein